MISAVVAVAVFGAAAAFDMHDRRVPNVIWGVGGLAFTVTTATVTSVFAAVFLGLAAFAAWYRGEIGGADMKALTILPLGVPRLWPVAVVIGVGGTALALRQREEVPLCVPLFAGVVLAFLARSFI